MINIDFDRFIKNRMWFGHWFSYSWGFDQPMVSESIDSGKWQHDPRHAWTPVILVANTFGIAGVDVAKLSDWALRYDKI